MQPSASAFIAFSCTDGMFLTSRSNARAQYEDDAGEVVVTGCSSRLIADQGDLSDEVARAELRNQVPAPRDIGRSVGDDDELAAALALRGEGFADCNGELRRLGRDRFEFPLRTARKEWNLPNELDLRVPPQPHSKIL